MEPVTKNISEISVVYHHRTRKRGLPKVTTSTDAFEQVLPGFDENTIGVQEQFVVMYLDQAQNVLGLYRAARGGITGTVADLRLILSVALKVLATGIIVAHNHPSGNLQPSRADEELTRKLAAAAKIMDIRLLDHIIVEPSMQEFISFADEGLI